MKRKEIESNQELKQKIYIFLEITKLPLFWPEDHIRIIYHYENELKEIPKCYCGKDTLFRSKNKGYRKTCSFYCNVNDPSKSERVKKTKLKKYGDENYNNFEKNKKTKLEKYGDENYNNRPKAFQTNVEVYGYYSPMKNDDVKNLSKKTRLEKYGDENYNNIEKIKNFWSKADTLYIQSTINKNKKTKLERYGDENYNNSQKMVETKIKEYGFYYNNHQKMIETKQKKFYKKNLERGIRHIKSDNNFYYFNCDNCKNDFSISSTLFSKRCRTEKIICTKCNPKFQSQLEIQLLSEISKFYKGEILQSALNIIDNLEIDIYLPEISLGIEFNGVYWHSTEYKDNLYHYNKKKLALHKGIDLIFIWEDDFTNEYEYTLDLIKNLIYLKSNNINIEIDSSPSDIYISNFGHIKEWILPIERSRGGS